MEKQKLAIIGCGFWAPYQLSAWLELEHVEVVAVCDADIEKAKKLAADFEVPNYYNDASKMINQEKIDIFDIITNVETHHPLVELAAKNGIKNIITQKPMSTDLESAQKMVAICNEKGAKLFVHEDYRWQKPIRRLKEILDSGVIGDLFKAKVSCLSSFPVFINQPFLAELDKFILTDMGSHLYDATRFLFGEVDKLWCQTRSITPGIKGEDVAATMFEMKNGMPVYTELSYASVVEHDSFSTLFVLVEGSKGSVYLGKDFEIRITTKEGTKSETVEFPHYKWANPSYVANHSSGVPLTQNILNDILNIEKAENTGEDNLKTVELVWAAYKSAETKTLVSL